MDDTTTSPRLAPALELVRELLVVDFSGCSAEDLTAELAAAEQLQRALRAAQARVLAAAQEAETARRMGYTDEAQYMAAELGLEPSEARRRAEEARRSTTPRMRALAEGRLSQGQVTVIGKAVDRLPESWSAEQVREFEETLVAFAPGTTVRRLEAQARRLLDAADPGRVARDAAWRAAQRRAVAGRQDLDLLTHARLTMDPELAALWRAVHARFAAPGRLWPEESTPDPRDDGQRMHDALVHVLRQGLGVEHARAGGPATIVVRMDLDQLHSLAGCGQTDAGVLVPVEQALHMAAGNHWFLALCDQEVELRLRRSRRTASAYQRLALFAAHGGCSHPDCDDDSAHCEYHHVVEWRHGGMTDVENLTALSPRCHALVHAAGWRGVPDRSAPRGIRWEPPPGARSGAPPPAPDSFGPDSWPGSSGPSGSGPSESGMLASPAVPFAALQDLSRALAAMDRVRRQAAA